MNDAVFGPEAWAPLARAWTAFLEGDEEAALTVHSDEGLLDPLPTALFFRSREELPGGEREALARARGRILDVGAGVGSLSLILQEEGRDVTAVEVIPEGVEIMVRRGVRNARRGRVQELSSVETFDTILVLMNGSGLASTLSRLPGFLRSLDDLLAPGGQVLLDSTDLLEADGAPSKPARPGSDSQSADGAPSKPARPGSDSQSADGVPSKRAPPGSPRGWETYEYPGEVQLQMEFRGEKGAPFPYLFVDPGTLSVAAGEVGWEMEVVWQGGGGRYLARLFRP